mmetsp:Transcript_3233/g.6660  ORF Transcript_3233/g.6660 Transcript_3233/m.6660 type:complete len:203 (+) Transcript_3233:310-918(+)
MYQWQKRSTGDFDTYDSVWSRSVISDYNHSYFYQNPNWDPRLSSKVVLNPSEASVNGFRLQNDLLNRLSREAFYSPSRLALPRISEELGLLFYSDTNYIYLTKYVRSVSNVFIPYIGDYRVVYNLVRDDLRVSVAGKQIDQDLVIWRDSVLLISDTARDSDELFDLLSVSSTFMWFMRVVFVLLIFAGGWLTHSSKSKGTLC